MSDFDKGKEYGYNHPNKLAGWSKSPKWNAGLKAGQRERHQIEQKKVAKRRARARINQRYLQFKINSISTNYYFSNQ